MRLPRDETNSAGTPFSELARELAPAVMRVIKAGWMIARRKPDSGPHLLEVPLTEHLREGMREALESEELGLGKDMVVLPGTESRSSPELSTPDGRLDIPVFSMGIFRRFREHDPHAIIECKRLSGNDPNLCREYVVEGMDRFRTGKYSGNHPVGFMVGYLIAGDGSAAAGRVNLYLQRRSREPEKLEPSTLITESWAWQSNHPRETRPSIELHHALLPFLG